MWKVKQNMVRNYFGLKVYDWSYFGAWKKFNLTSATAAAAAVRAVFVAGVRSATTRSTSTSASVSARTVTYNWWRWNSFSMSCSITWNVTSCLTVVYFYFFALFFGVPWIEFKHLKKSSLITSTFRVPFSFQWQASWFANVWTSSLEKEF